MVTAMVSFSIRIIVIIHLIHITIHLITIPTRNAASSISDLVLYFLELFINFNESETVHLNTQPSYWLLKLFELKRFVAHVTRFLKNLLKFALREKNLEVFAELHEFSQVYLIHWLLYFLKLPPLGNMLTTVEVENFLHSSMPKLVNIKHRLFWRYGLWHSKSLLTLSVAHSCSIKIKLS